MQKLLNCSQVTELANALRTDRCNNIWDLSRFTFVPEDSNNSNYKQWKRWYLTTYCSNMEVCESIKYVNCNFFIEELEAIGCTSIITITDL